LLRKAQSDLTAACALAEDPDQGDDVIGFHVQQTVEKSVKAVLASLDVDYPRRTTSTTSCGNSRSTT
jgi:HEPN domain-containing protein